MYINVVEEIVIANSAEPHFPGNHGVVVRIYDVVKSNDKKKKEPVLTEIARGKVDTMALLSSQQFKATVSAETLVPLVEIEAGTPPILLSLGLSINAPMLSPEQSASSNILSITVDGLFSIPDTWALPTSGWCTK